MKKVAVIILTYNGKKYLPDLLGSIFDFKPKTVEQKIIVIDNYSSDETVNYLEQNYPEVLILKQTENLGFAEGNNVGLKYAIKHDFDYVMLLNQDTKVTDQYLDNLVKAIEIDEQIAAVQPRIMLYPETDLINSLGNVIHYLCFGYTYGHRSKQSVINHWSSFINYCSGAACLIKTSVLKKVGLFNKDLFMYHEDLDLGWRFKLAGYSNKVITDAVVYHQYEFSRSIRKYYFLERNRYLILFQNYHCLTILIILPALILMELGLFAFSFVNGWWRKKLLVYLFFLNPVNWLRILAVRRKVQSKRIIKEREAVRNFSGLIEHQEINNPVLKIVNPFFSLYWTIVKNIIIW